MVNDRQFKDRITRADYHNSDDEQFTYDKLGNRITMYNRNEDEIVYAHNSANEYTTVGGESVTHDLAVISDNHSYLSTTIKVSG